MGDYMTGAEVWAAFKLTTPVPRAIGVFENQPRPATSSVWKTALIMTAAAWLIASLLHFSGGKKVVFHRSYTTGQTVSAAFDVTGHQGPLKVETHNRTVLPLYMQYSLVRDGDPKALKFGRQVGTTDVASIPSIGSGHYTLTAEPDGAATGQFDIDVYRDAPSFGWVFFATVFLLVPPAFQSLGAGTFERSRWEGSNL
jgi:hypothetical protein